MYLQPSRKTVMAIRYLPHWSSRFSTLHKCRACHMTNKQFSFFCKISINFASLPPVIEEYFRNVSLYFRSGTAKLYFTCVSLNGRLDKCIFWEWKSCVRTIHMTFGRESHDFDSRFGIETTLACRNCNCFTHKTLFWLFCCNLHMLFTCFCTSASLKAILTDFSHLAQNRNKIQKFRRISRTTVPEKVFKITIKIFKLYNFEEKH